MSDSPQESPNHSPTSADGAGFPPPAGPKKSTIGLIVGIVVGAVVLFGGCCVIGAAGLMLPALGQARDAAFRLQSSANLRGIAQGLILYADSNQSQFPGPDEDWATLLLDRGLIVPEQLTDPRGGGGQTVYFYVPASSWTFEVDRVLAYEHPDLIDGGGNVAFHDNHVEFITEPEFSAMIGSLTLEDGTRWAPHEDVELDRD